MPELNYLAVVVSIVGAFVLSGVWYGVLGSRMAALDPAYAEPSRPSAVTAGVELSRNLVLTLVVAGLADRLGVDDLAGGLLLGLVLWIGFPLGCSPARCTTRRSRPRWPGSTPVTGCSSCC